MVDLDVLLRLFTPVTRAACGDSNVSVILSVPGYLVGFIGFVIWWKDYVDCVSKSKDNNCSCRAGVNKLCFSVECIFWLKAIFAGCSLFVLKTQPLHFCFSQHHLFVRRPHFPDRRLVQGTKD